MLTEYFHICKEASDNFKIAFEGTVLGRMEQIAVVIFTIDSVASPSPFSGNKHKSLKIVKVSKLALPGFVNIIVQKWSMWHLIIPVC